MAMCFGWLITAVEAICDIFLGGGCEEVFFTFPTDLYKIFMGLYYRYCAKFQVFNCYSQIHRLADH